MREVNVCKTVVVMVNWRMGLAQLRFCSLAQNRSLDRYQLTFVPAVLCTDWWNETPK